MLTEVAIEGDNLQSTPSRQGISTVMYARILICGAVDPSLLRPQRRDVLVIPRELVTEVCGLHRQWRGACLGPGIVITEGGVYWRTAEGGLHHSEAECNENNSYLR
jgi:hypothetical protein